MRERDDPMMMEVESCSHEVGTSGNNPSRVLSSHVAMHAGNNPTGTFPQTMQTNWVSVFERLSVNGDNLMSGNQFGEVQSSRNVKSGKGLNFAEVVGSSQNETNLQFFPLESKNQTKIQISIELAKEVAKTTHHVGVGQKKGKDVDMEQIQEKERNERRTEVDGSTGAKRNDKEVEFQRAMGEDVTVHGQKVDKIMQTQGVGSTVEVKPDQPTQLLKSVVSSFRSYKQPCRGTPIVSNHFEPLFSDDDYVEDRENNGRSNEVVSSNDEEGGMGIGTE
ncbi:hypothetical protein L6452_42173 [Arctium lappa]|uniref:Uncharacterized protein n=1 Tax=Arctium lappa TaxID=4217 RepID=A0ACB8XJ99_ARCLA|nr:hypothetical protein L6452_42173 [Arctium lappa]